MSKKKSGRKPSYNMLHSRRVNGRLKLKWLVFGGVFGLSVAGLSALILTSMSESRVMHDTESYHPATYKVAKNFMCGCPECDIELVTCNCNLSTGGTYELYFISEQLKLGLSEQQVTTAVNDKFGRMKQPLQNVAPEAVQSE